MLNFGVISEGETDFAVIENILIGYFNQDMTGYVSPLQPRRGKMGGWSRIFNYCSSSEFKYDFETNDFMIIQVDTDRSFDANFDVPHDNQEEKLSVEQLIEKVKIRFNNLFSEHFGDTFLPNFGHRILFAISVHSMECWLLPLYYKELKDKLELKNCYEKLNKKVKGLNKKYSFYDAISSDFRSNKKLLTASKDNPSFKIFLENELNIKIPIKKEENTEGV